MILMELMVPSLQELPRKNVLRDRVNKRDTRLLSRSSKSYVPEQRGTWGGTRLLWPQRSARRGSGPQRLDGGHPARSRHPQACKARPAASPRPLERSVYALPPLSHARPRRQEGSVEVPPPPHAADDLLHLHDPRPSVEAIVGRMLSSDIVEGEQPV